MEAIDIRAVIELLAGVAGAVLWWNFRMLAKTALETQRELTDFKLLVALEYARHADLDKKMEQIDKVVERIESKLDALFDKIDGKMDKDHV